MPIVSAEFNTIKLSANFTGHVMIIGREKELEELEKIFKSKKAEFAAVYGRRRVGKTFLIREFFSKKPCMFLYLSWVEPNLSTIKNIKKIGHYWLEKHHAPSFRSWAGHAFEAVCFKHIDKIKHALHIQTSATVGSWQHITVKGCDDDGAQIDLLLDRDDDVITICEIKYTNQPYQLTKEEARLLIKKIDIFKAKTKTRKQINVVLITNIPIKHTMYSEEIITDNVILRDFLI